VQWILHPNTPIKTPVHRVGDTSKEELKRQRNSAKKSVCRELQLGTDPSGAGQGEAGPSGAGQGEAGPSGQRPKGPVNAQMFFQADGSAQLKAGGCGRATASAVYKLWQGMSADQKAPYEEQAAADRARFIRERGF
jgi:hypothetical protein